MQSSLKRIYGLEYEEIFSDNYIIWKTWIRNPFQMSDERYRIGLNSKFLLEARKKGVYKLIVQIGQAEKELKIPTLNDLQLKENNNEFELKPSMFQGSPPIKIYHFIV